MMNFEDHLLEEVEKAKFKIDELHKNYYALQSSQKAAAEATQSAAKALASSNVVVGVVAPGFVDTAMAAEVLNGERGDAIRGDSPFNRVASVDEVAEAVLYFTHTNAAWSSGAIIDVNGASYLRS